MVLQITQQCIDRLKEFAASQQEKMGERGWLLSVEDEAERTIVVGASCMVESRYGIIDTVAIQHEKTTCQK